MTKLSIGAEDHKDKSDSVELIQLELVGVDYEIRKVKTSVAVKIAKTINKEEDDMFKQLETLDSLVKMMFGKLTPAIQKRLDDPADRLDYPHIVQLLKAMISLAGAEGNPTG